MTTRMFDSEASSGFARFSCRSQALSGKVILGLLFDSPAWMDGLFHHCCAVESAMVTPVAICRVLTNRSVHVQAYSNIKSKNCSHLLIWCSVWLVMSIWCSVCVILTSRCWSRHRHPSTSSAHQSSALPDVDGVARLVQSVVVDTACGTPAQTAEQRDESCATEGHQTKQQN